MSAPSPLRVSAIVPARDAAPTLAVVLPALRAALPRDAELLVVDDGSADDTATAAEGCGARVLRCSDGRGPAAARNRGARDAAGDLLLFVDADCRPQDDAVALLVRAFDDPAVAAAFGSYDDRPAVRTTVSLYKNLAHHFVHQRSAEDASTFWAGLGAVRRDAFRASGGFDETYARPSIEDVDLGYRLKAAGHRIRLVKAAQATHLKRWTLGSWLVSDLRDRALPWARLLRSGRSLPRSLNFTPGDRVASALVGLGWVLLACAALSGAPGRSVLLGGAVLALAASVALDLPFFRFMARQVSFGFAIAAAGLHVVHRTVGLIGLVLGFLGPLPKKAEPRSPLRSY
ncbi:MAG TPA: glycosyltransferase [Vicinamibacteria bacterium]|nr:glycosyltransferase [Vicinamibacteria bacterium]